MGKNDTAVNLAWSTSTDNIDVKGYRIYANGKQMQGTPNTSATITGLQPDATYTIEVRAEDLAGNLSAPSSAKKVITDMNFDKAQGAIGINFEGVCDYCREPIFVDLFKTARPWVNWSYPDYEFDMDEFGNIRSLEAGREAYTLMGIGQQGNFRKGKYVVTYEGEGDLQFWQTGGSKLITSKPGNMLVDVQSDGIWFTLKSVNPANYIRNIKVIHEDDIELAKTHLFQPDFIERWQDFKVTRFMSTMATNNTKIVEWADRTTPQHFTQTGFGSDIYSGLAVEYLVDITNQLGSDPWFNMPTMANDEYVRNFATYVRDHLHPNAKIYIEYSNETWNTIFFQSAYCMEQGKNLVYT